MFFILETIFQKQMKQEEKVLAHLQLLDLSLEISLTVLQCLNHTLLSLSECTRLQKRRKVQCVEGRKL